MLPSKEVVVAFLSILLEQSENSVMDEREGKDQICRGWGGNMKGFARTQFQITREKKTL